METLIIDETAVDLMATLRKYAEANPFSVDDMLDRLNKQAPQPGDLPEFRCKLQVGYLAVFTIEDIGKGPNRHLSVSLYPGKELPSPFAVRQIMSHFGFGTDFDSCHVSTSKGESEVRCIHIIQPLS